MVSALQAELKSGPSGWLAKALQRATPRDTSRFDPHGRRGLARVIQEQGRVEGIDGEFALIEAAQSGGCSACGVKSGCRDLQTRQVLAAPSAGLARRQRPGLRPGETVTLHLPEAALLYRRGHRLPTAPARTAGGGVGAAALGPSDLWAALGAISGFLAGLIASRWLGRRHAARYAPAAMTRNAPPVASVLPIRIFPQGR